MNISSHLSFSIIKKSTKLIYFVLLAVSVLLLNAPFSSADPVSGLIAHWKLDESFGTIATDSSGNGHDGAINGALAAAGHIGGAMNFDGINDYIQVPDAAPLDITGSAITLSMWVNPASGKTGQLGGVLKGLSVNQERYFLGVDFDTYRVDFRTYTTTGKTQILGGSVPANTWTHIAGTYDGSAMKIYVNGVLVASTVKSGNIQGSIDPLLIGRRTLTDARFFAGAIDDVQIYNRALTATEIQQVMDATGGDVPPPPSDTTAPTISVTVPTAGTTVSGTVTMSASASDNVGVTKVEFYVDGVLKETDPSSPYSFSWDTTNAGAHACLGAHTHALTAKAYDVANNVATSAAVTVNMNNPSYCGASGTSPSSGLVAHYTFDNGNAQDSAGTNHGTVNGATPTASGKYGTALSFDGTDFINLPNSTPLAITGAITLSAWVRADSIGCHIVSKSGNERGWGLGLGSSPNKATMQIGRDASTIVSVTSLTSLLPGQWYHLAGTYEPSTAIRIYINGVLDNSNTANIPASQNDNDAQWNNPKIGTSANSGSGCYDGVIDDVQIYNRALTATEIQQVMDDGFVVPPQAPTVALSASPSLITSGQSLTLTWSSTDATSCTASGGWSGTKGTSGTQSVSPESNTTYTLECTGSGGSASQSATVTVAFAQQQQTGAGALVVDPDDPRRLRFVDGSNHFLCGAGDPEDFLYRGMRLADGTRAGDQDTLIDKIAPTGANGIYFQMIRSFGGDGAPDHNPFINSDPSQGLDQDILDQWERWFAQLEENGVLIYLFFYDDSATIWNTGDIVGPDEAAFIQSIVNRFEHHPLLVWVVAEEYDSVFSPARASAIAREIRMADDFDHIISVHKNEGVNFEEFADDSSIDQFLMQSSGSVAELHDNVVTAWQLANGRYVINMAEAAAHGAGATARQKNWATAMAGATVMVFEMDIASTPESDLRDCGRQVEFLQRMSLAGMEPRDDLARGGTRWVLAEEGRRYLAYTPDSATTMGVGGLQAGSYDLTWFDTETGNEMTQSGVNVTGGDAVWSVPNGFSDEIVLWVRPVVANQIPVADAGDNKIVNTGSLVALDGSGSFDPENSSLTYSWSIDLKPAGSNATLSDSTIVNPAFTVDIEGTYAVSLIVNDGSASSTANNVIITANTKNIVFPGTSWITKTPEDVGMDSAKLTQVANSMGGSGVIIKDGYLVKSWGTVSSKGDWASASKPVISTLLFFAVEEGRLSGVNDLVRPYVQSVTGRDLIEKDRTMTFSHLSNMVSGYTLNEAPGAAWAYNDYAIKLYARVLFDGVFQQSADAAVRDMGRLGTLEFEDGSIFGSRGGHGVDASPRDFARIGWFWLNKGNWKGEQLLPESYFANYMKSQVPADLPRTGSTSSNDYLGVGTFGGNADQTQYGPGIYGSNWWFNTNKSAWPDAPVDTVEASGSWNRELMFVIPSSNVVIAARGNWGTWEPGTNSQVNGILKLLVESISTSPDTEAPTIPTNLSAATVSSSRIDLSWTASTDNVGVVGYKVFRNSVEIADTSLTSYSDTFLSAETEYTYYVLAYDVAGNLSGQSLPISATTQSPPPPDATPPSVPQDIAITDITTSRVDLTWSASTDSESGVAYYKIYRNGSLVASPVSTFYSDTGLLANTTYTYEVSAVNSVNLESERSVAVTGTTLAETAGLIAHWKLDEVSGTIATDSSGNGHDGVLLNGPVWTAGVLGSALNFDGTNDRVEVAGFVPPQTGTVSMWLYADILNNRHRIMGGHDAYEATIESSKKFSNQFFRAGSSFLSGASTPSTGTWYHVAFTYDYTTGAQAIYVNGVLDASDALATSNPGGPFTLSIGTRTGTSEHFDGRLDDIRVYNRVLSPSEIQSLVNSL